MKLSILVPAYNEERTITEILRRALAADLPVPREVIVVDDASNDGTRAALEAAADPVVRVFRHERNRGKGAALRTALGRATGEIAIIQDANLEYDPKEYPALLSPILEGRADVVFGNRFHGGPHRVLYGSHRLGNWAVTMWVNALTNMNFADIEVGYKVFRTDVLRRLRLVSHRFGIEPEPAVKTARLGVRVYEVPISYHGRTCAEGKKITGRDGAAAGTGARGRIVMETRRVGCCPRVEVNRPREEKCESPDEAS